MGEILRSVGAPNINRLEKDLEIKIDTLWNTLPKFDGSTVVCALHNRDTKASD